MDKIDTTTEEYTSVAKEGIDTPDAIFYAIIVSKINEIIEWINSQ